jgi:hypothetical protein
MSTRTVLGSSGVTPVGAVAIGDAVAVAIGDAVAVAIGDAVAVAIGDAVAVVVADGVAAGVEVSPSTAVGDGAPDTVPVGSTVGGRVPGGVVEAAAVSAAGTVDVASGVRSATFLDSPQPIVRSAQTPAIAAKSRANIRERILSSGDLRYELSRPS